MRSVSALPLDELHVLKVGTLGLCLLRMNYLGRAVCPGNLQQYSIAKAVLPAFIDIEKAEPIKSKDLLR